MPELSRFYNMVISMRYSDDEKHHKPHVHVAYAGYKASVDFDGDLLAGFLPKKQLNLVRGWVAMHEDELYTQWENAIQDIPIEKIEPLDRR